MTIHFAKIPFLTATCGASMPSLVASERPACSSQLEQSRQYGGLLVETPLSGGSHPLGDLRPERGDKLLPRPPGQPGHLDISDRVTIEKSLREGDSLSQIARILGVSTSTVSREVRQNRTRYLVRASIKRELCTHWAECTVTGLCDVGCARTACKRCRSNQCTLLCPEWEERTCELLERAPFVCGQCKRRANCGFRRARYGARDAQTKYERRLCESRSGVSVTPEQLESMVSHARRLRSYTYAKGKASTTCSRLLAKRCALPR